MILRRVAENIRMLRPMEFNILTTGRVRQVGRAESGTF
jgi:hypothetical protein